MDFVKQIHYNCEIFSFLQASWDFIYRKNPHRVNKCFNVLQITTIVGMEINRKGSSELFVILNFFSPILIVFQRLNKYLDVYYRFSPLFPRFYDWIFYLFWQCDILFVPTVWYFICFDSVIFYLFWQCDILFVLTVCYFICSDSVIFYFFRQCDILFVPTVCYFLFFILFQ